MSKKRSEIWLHFEEVECGNKVKCIYCKQTLTTKNGSMGNMHRHMKGKHLTTSIKRQKLENNSVFSVDDTVSTTNQINQIENPPSTTGEYITQLNLY